MISLAISWSAIGREHKSIETWFHGVQVDATYRQEIHPRSSHPISTLPLPSSCDRPSSCTVDLVFNPVTIASIEYDYRRVLRVCRPE